MSVGVAGQRTNWHFFDLGETGHVSATQTEDLQWTEVEQGIDGGQRP